MYIYIYIYIYPGPRPGPRPGPGAAFVSFERMSVVASFYRSYIAACLETAATLYK